MGLDVSTRTRAPRRRRLAATGIAVLLGASLLAASPALARNDFDNAFEAELGRIAARSAVGAGAFLLFRGFGGHDGYGVYERRDTRPRWRHRRPHRESYRSVEPRFRRHERHDGCRHRRRH